MGEEVVEGRDGAAVVEERQPLVVQVEQRSHDVSGLPPRSGVWNQFPCILRGLLYKARHHLVNLVWLTYLCLFCYFGEKIVLILRQIHFLWQKFSD